ncbi:hypothetical protein [Streptomyces kaniharaensis]|nr:hypothetical protein [Streptomyces kaniharaensis]
MTWWTDPVVESLIDRIPSERTTEFGEPIPVDLLGVTLDTAGFQTYA